MSAYDPRLTSRPYRLLRLWILARDNNLCQIQGPRCTRYATQVDHVIPRGEGGDVYDPANLRAACAQCNGRLAAQRTNYYRYRVTRAVYETRL